MTGLFRTIEMLKMQSGRELAAVLDMSDCSEKKLAERWHAGLSRNPHLYEEGWYVPPPHGIIALFGKPADGYQRVSQSSFRPESLWPRSDVFFAEEDVVALYASPIHRETKLIGDFGLMLYRGSSSELREHYEEVLQTTLYIGRQTQAGMTFSEVYEMAMSYARGKGFVNNIESPSDATGTNIGHTIPLSYVSDPSHESIKKARGLSDIQEVLRSGRKFINAAERQVIEANMAFTIEPRLSAPGLPNSWFHVTVIFEGGERRICHGFEPVFESFGMQNLLRFLN